MRQHLKTAATLLLGGALAFGVKYGGEAWFAYRMRQELVPVFSVFEARLQKLEGVAPVVSK